MVGVGARCETLGKVGALVQFSCPGCGYTAEVSGGPDRGMRVSTQTMICLGCRELVDVTTGPAQSLDPPSSKRRRCPRCRSRRFEPWGSGENQMTRLPIGGAAEVAAEDRFDCPKCGQTMEAGDVVTHWD